MKHFFTLLLVTAAFALRAQMLTPTVIASTGGFASNANGSLSYTVAEMTMVQTFSSANNFLTQGFQQPEPFPTGILDLTKDEFGSFAVYPNPAVDHVQFGFQFPEKGKISVTLYNSIGQKMADVYFANYDSGKMTESFSVSNLAAGEYLLTAYFTSEKDGQTHLITKKLQVIN